MFKFKASYLPLLAEHMAQHDVRYYLNGIYIEPVAGAGVILVATDGHRMAMIYDQTGTADKPQIFSITSQLVSAAGKRMKRPRMRDRTVEFEDGKRIIVIDEVGNEAYIQPGLGTPIIDGKFPDWRRVVPKRLAQGQGLATFNGAYAATACEELLKLAKREGKGSYGSIRMWHADEENPYSQVIVVGSNAMENARIIIMPMRDDVMQPDRPDWLSLRIKPTFDEAQRLSGGLANIIGKGNVIHDTALVEGMFSGIIRATGGVPA